MSILISRDIGTHGASVFALRKGISLENNIISDCASLYPQIKALITSGIKIISLRDATRGGLSSVLNEWAKSSDICIEIDEKSIPIKDEVRGICEMLGFEAFNLANEGTFVLAVEQKDEKKALEILQKTHKSSAIIGKSNSKYKQKVILNSSWGTKRFLDLPTGELLPRIC
jgi:hydrogenase expression/formation protein HypE